MKNILTITFGLLFSQALLAQVEVSTKSFELESQNKQKGWYVLEAGKEGNSGDVFVKLGKPKCDVSASSSGNIVYTTFHGLGWTIDKLIFSPAFEFKSTSSKSYSNTREALAADENVFGKSYKAVPGSSVADVLAGMAMPTNAINNSFMFTKIVVGTAGITGFKVGTSYISTRVTGQVTRKGDFCGENPSVFKISAVDAKEEKGQKWIPVYNNPVPNGGNILFNTVGVSADPNVQYYVFRKYDENGSVIKERALSFNYQCLPSVKEIEKAPGKYDYVLIMSPINYKKSKLSVSPANEYEYIMIDGESFEIKDQFKFSMTYSLWRMTHAIESNGAIYLAGVAGVKNSVYPDFSMPKLADFPNFQVVKIAGGKLAYATALNENQMELAAKSIEGLKSKTDYNLHLKDVQLVVKDGRLIISGQQETTSKRSSLIAAVFNSFGQLDAYLAKSTNEFGRSSISFNADGSRLYWLLEDLGEYNEILPGNALLAKKAKEIISAVEVVTYDLTKKKLIHYQSLKNEEWALNYQNPILFENENELLLLGNKITKKAKESEVVFIKVKK